MPLAVYVYVEVAGGASKPVLGVWGLWVVCRIGTDYNSVAMGIIRW